MSQWGEERVIDGCRLVPLLATQTWAPASPESTIERVLLVDAGDLDPTAAAAVETSARSRFRGRPYVAWLSIPLIAPDAMPLR